MLRSIAPPAVISVGSLLLAMSACSSSSGSDAPATPDGGSSSGTMTSGGTSGTSGSSGSSGTSGTSGGPVVYKPVRFVAMGDTGRGDAGQYKIANTISAKCKKDGCDFVQLLGDNLYDNGASSVDDPIWAERFETPYAAIDLDFYAVLGNHDYGANGAGTDFPKAQFEIDYTKKSKKFKMPASYFHFAKEHVELFELDTQKQIFAQDAAQRTDMAAAIAASKAEWKIAVGHHPYKSNGPHGNAGNYDGTTAAPLAGAGVKSFLETIVCGKVDVYFSGHDHSQQWLNESCMGTELAVSGAGSLTTQLGGTNPSLFESVALGFLYIVIDGKTLTAEFIDENGAVEFTHTIKKP